jgi:hypothetical protein
VKRHRPGRQRRRGNQGPSPALVPPVTVVTGNARDALVALVARARRTESLISDKRELPVFGALVREWDESADRPLWRELS